MSATKDYLSVGPGITWMEPVKTKNDLPNAAVMLIAEKSNYAVLVEDSCEAFVFIEGEWVQWCGASSFSFNPEGV